MFRSKMFDLVTTSLNMNTQNYWPWHNPQWRRPPQGELLWLLNKHPPRWLSYALDWEAELKRGAWTGSSQSPSTKARNLSESRVRSSYHQTLWSWIRRGLGVWPSHWCAILVLNTVIYRLAYRALVTRSTWSLLNFSWIQNMKDYHGARLVIRQATDLSISRDSLRIL
jgi:hypothetical protein